MRLQTFGILAAAGQVAFAFTDTSPFFLFSTSELLIPTSKSLQSASAVSSNLLSSLSGCPSTFYFLVSQAGVHSDDFSKQQAAPSLSRWLSGKQKDIRTAASITDVVGSVDQTAISSMLIRQCGAEVEDIDMTTGSFPMSKDSSPRIFRIDFPEPIRTDKAEALLANDAFLGSFVDSLPSQNYTVVLTTTPSSSFSIQAEQTSYEMDSSSLQEAMHSDLKRDLGNIHARAKKNDVLPSGALFDRYQYFTPGLFMGFLVALPLLLILYVAIRALASLEVSYAAFDKDTGPQSANAPKKQQ